MTRVLPPAVPVYFAFLFAGALAWFAADAGLSRVTVIAAALSAGLGTAAYAALGLLLRLGHRR